MKIWLKDFFEFKVNLGKGNSVRELPTSPSDLTMETILPKIMDDAHLGILQITREGHIVAKDITKWVDNLTGGVWGGAILHFQDPETGHTYEIKRVD